MSSDTGWLEYILCILKSWFQFGFEFPPLSDSSEVGHINSMKIKVFWSLKLICLCVSMLKTKIKTRQKPIQHFNGKMWTINHSLSFFYYEEIEYNLPFWCNMTQCIKANGWSIGRSVGRSVVCYVHKWWWYRTPIHRPTFSHLAGFSWEKDGNTSNSELLNERLFYSGDNRFEIRRAWNLISRLMCV